MKISPWFLAFILVVSIAAYLLVDKSRVFELFTLRTDQRACESAYQKCLLSGGTNTYCTTQYNACNLNVSGTYDTSGNYQALAKASTLRTQQAACESSFQKCISSGKDSKTCTAQYNKCIIDVSKQNNTSNNYETLAAAFNVLGNTRYNPNLSPPPGINTILPNSTHLPTSSWPWDNTTQVSKATDISGSWDKAWDNIMGGISSTMTTHGTYTPHRNTVLPTHIPSHPQHSLTAIAPTDAGTGADTILAGSTLSPSLRQMIRSDISGTVKKEFDDANSRYQIQYAYQ